MTTQNTDVPTQTMYQNWGEASGYDDSQQEITVDLVPFGEWQKFSLAKWLLLGVAILFILGGIALLTNPTNGTVIFDTCKAVLPPIATLVIGYYFSEKGAA